MKSPTVSLTLALTAFALGALLNTGHSDRRERNSAVVEALNLDSPSMSVESKRKMRNRLIRAVCGPKREHCDLEKADSRRIRPDR